MICEKYSTKIRVIRLRDEGIDGLHVTKDKVGKGNTIYIVNYRNHFIPLLSNIKKDIKKSIEVSREEAYGNVVDSNLNSISQPYISTPLQDIESFSHKQSGCSRSPGEENRETDVSSGKRKRSVTNKDDKASKRAHMDVNVTSNENSEFPRNLKEESRQDELHTACQTKRYIPHHLIKLMYQLDLSVLCSLRKSTYEHKYPLLSLAFEDSEIDKFNDIALHYEEKSIHIRIENVDKYYTDNDINYAKLFNKGKQSFSINNYFDSFVKHLTSKVDSSLDNIEYLVIYTNSGLDLTEEKELKKGRSRNFYPFKFDSISVEECDILKDFLFTNDDTKWGGFYQFSQDKTTREELLKRLKFSPAKQKIIKERKLSQKEIKEKFLDKLVFTVNQPNREALNGIIKNEIEKHSTVEDDYIALQERILRDLTAPEKLKKLGPGIIYKFNLLMFFLHDMFLHTNISSINSERKSHDISNDITVHYKDKITYVKVHTTDSSIDYSQLFSSRQHTFSVDKLFTLFIEELKEDIKYFIIYTNADLDLTEEKRLKKGLSKDFYPLEFDSIDIRKKKYKILRDCSCINENGLYQFAQGETTRKKLLSLLKLLPSLQKGKGRLSNESEREIKEKFLDKLIFAVNQPNREELNSVIRNEIGKSNVSYNYEELHEIALRWSESHEFGPITKVIMEKLLEDIKNNRSSYQEFQNKGIDEEIKFVKNIVGEEETPAFNKFLDFLVKGEGRKYLEVLKRKGIKLTSMSSILDRARTNATKAFKGLYDLWFDEKGNKTQYLKTLEEEGINLSSVSSILSGAGANAAEAFKDLYDLWFDEKGNKTQYLKTLEEEGINLSRISSILSRAGTNATKAFKDLYDLWFDEKGNKTQYLKTLEGEGINLSSVSSILSGAGANAAKAFKDLYDLWFDEKGNKTQYLKTLEKEGINLANVSSILNGARTNAAKAFKDLYDLWFDEKGNKTQYLKTLEEEGINLANISGILSKAGANATKAFKDLYDLWFNAKGNKTQYLKALEEEGINLANMSSILNGAGANAAKAFKDLYDLWFDEKGNKTQYSKIPEEEGMNLANMSSILNGAGANAAKAFKDLYDLWFDEKGNKTQYLKALEEEGMNLANMSGILSKAGANAAKAFKDLYDLWFDKQEGKTQYLKTLEEEGMNLANMSSILNGAGANAAKAFKDLYDLWFGAKGNKTQYLKALEGKGINLTNMSSILHGVGANAAKAFKDLYDLWFGAKGNKTQYLKALEGKGINLTNMSSILHGVGANAAKAFKDLYDLWFDKQEDKTQYLKTLEEEGINLSNMSSILNGAGTKAPKAFKDLYDLWFDAEGNKTQCLKTLKEKKINLTNMSSILGGAGASAAKAFKDLYDLWFDEKRNKTQYLKTLEEEGINLSNISSILNGAGANSADAFRELYNTFFNEQGNKTQYLKTLEEEGINLTNMSSILSGTGVNAAQTFKDLYDLWFDKKGNKKQHLNHFIRKKNGEKSFTMHNLSGMLSTAGANAKDAFEKLHSVCFNDKGRSTRLLDDFYNADFEPSNLSSILCGAGVRASSILKRLHSVCFDDKGERTELLDDFCNVGFRPGDLCNILSGAADRLEKFHDFCFIGETKKYLNHFVNEKKGFTLSNLSKILHGAKANICSALKDFHDVCFDETGNKTQFLDDFHKVGFKPNNLSNILSMAGNNASSIFRNFHKSCFNKENYLNHFLAEKKLFTPKNLSGILGRVGLNICPTFEKLHDLCFDKAGNKTSYLNDLIRNNPPYEIYNILYKKVRKAPSAFLDEQNISEGDKITNVGLESSSSSGRTEQGQNLGNSQQNDPKVKRKTRKRKQARNY
ncbi:fructose-1,6-bisphosphatase isoform X2 [Lasioglossum baleicum]